MIPRFNGDFLVYENSAIALKFIESMGYSNDREELIIDCLRDDKFLSIRTVSGNDYIVSVRKQLVEWQLKDNTINDWQEAIFNAWKFNLHRKI